MGSAVFREVIAPGGAGPADAHALLLGRDGVVEQAGEPRRPTQKPYLLVRAAASLSSDRPPTPELPLIPPRVNSEPMSGRARWALNASGSRVAESSGFHLHCKNAGDLGRLLLGFVHDVAGVDVGSVKVVPHVLGSIAIGEAMVSAGC